MNPVGGAVDDLMHIAAEFFDKPQSTVPETYYGTAQLVYAAAIRTGGVTELDTHALDDIGKTQQSCFELRTGMPTKGGGPREADNLNMDLDPHSCSHW
jgi:hypothetical protein